MSIIIKVIIWAIVIVLFGLFVRWMAKPLTPEQRKRMQARLEENKRKNEQARLEEKKKKASLRKVAAPSPLEIFIRQLQDLSKDKQTIPSAAPSGPKKFSPSPDRVQNSAGSGRRQGPSDESEPSKPVKFIPKNQTETAAAVETPKPVRFIPNTGGGDNKSDVAASNPVRFIPNIEGGDNESNEAAPKPVKFNPKTQDEDNKSGETTSGPKKFVPK